MPRLLKVKPPKYSLKSGCAACVVLLLVIVVVVCILYPFRMQKKETFFEFADGSKVCNDTFFKEIDGFLTSEQCNRLIQLAKDKGLHDSRVGEESHTLDTAVRRSSQTWFAHSENDIALHIKHKVLATIKGAEMAHCFQNIDEQKSFEDVQVVCYQADGKYDPHFDGTECGDDLKQQCYKNQRIATFLIYLNDDFTGGETRFPNISNTRIKPKKGKALFFWVSDPANRLVYNETLHGGDPVVSGEKWIATQWVRSHG